jgi:hypothetical protein
MLAIQGSTVHGVKERVAESGLIVRGLSVDDLQVLSAAAVHCLSIE